MLNIKSNSSVLLATAMLILCCALATNAMSIETSDPQPKPVKVTRKNSGPSYEIDLKSSNNNNNENDDSVEKRKINEIPVGASGPVASSAGLEDQMQPQLPKLINFGPIGAIGNSNNGGSVSGGSSEDADQPSIGHVTIRRIFLVPMMSSGSQQSQSQQENERQPSSELSGPSGNPSLASAASPFGMRPLWPFLTPPAQQMISSGGGSGGSESSASERRTPPAMLYQRHHILGGDQASRSPMATANNADRDQIGPIFDPIKMMIDLMHQAINERLVPPPQEGEGESGANKKQAAAPIGNADDLNKEAATDSSNPIDSDSGENKSILSQDKKAPKSQNETSEEIVEIEGKKYLKKSVINRHVGENIIFMTRRLIFVPLNETESIGTAAATTTVAPKQTTTTTSELAQPETVNSGTTTTEKELEATTTTTTTELPTTKAAEGPTSAAGEEKRDAVASETEELTTVGGSSTATTKSPSLLDRVTDAIDKVAERMVEKANEDLQSQATSSTTSTTTTTTTTTTAPSTTVGGQQ